MPELPEVETIRQDLCKEILDKKIKSVDVFDDKVIKMDKLVFVRGLQGKSFFDIYRIGKLLIFKISDKKNYLLIHLKMTGQLIYADGSELIGGGHSLKNGPATMVEKIGGDLPNKYTRFAIVFNKKESLYFNDLRKFGYAKIVNQEELEAIKSLFGIEPLTNNFKLAGLIDVMSGRRKSIKALLLDQRLVSGLGNIYVDEALFMSGINPRRRAFELKKEEIKILHANIQKLIKKAVKYRGTTFSDYSDTRGNKGNFSNFLQVYGRGGEKCNVCKTKIEKIKEAGRGTHFCPKCQK